ncbi:hypothetical protein [Oerskovia turbata]
MDVVARIGLDRLRLVAAAPGAVSPQLAVAALAELSRVGVRLVEADAMTGDLARRVPLIVAHVRRRRGQLGDYAPLFSGFPDALPDHDDVRVRAALAALRLTGDQSPSDEELRAALDFSGLGWWPASSVPQDVPAALLARARQETLPADGHVEWWDVRAVSPDVLDDALRAFMLDAFMTPVSLREDVAADLDALARHYGVDAVDPARVTFRETRTLLARLVWETDLAALPGLGLTPDDLLRLFASLTGSDVSLAEPIRYPRLTRAQRRAVVAALEASARRSDVFRRRGMWLAVARGLHLAEHAAPRTQEVFARLRATRHDASSLMSRFERAVVTDFAGAVDLLVAEAPTLVLRHLRRLASLADESPTRRTTVLDAVRSVGPDAPLRVVLAARHQVADNGGTYPRVVLTKGGGVLPIANEVGHLAVSASFRAELLDALTHGAHRLMAARPDWSGERVRIEPGLDRVLVPESLRSTSAGVIQVERGSALPAGTAPVLRLFVHWKHAASDLDLSLLALGEDFEVLEQVSWTRLRSRSIVHSGDITSAPAGAQEFIDVGLAGARKRVGKRGWRYLAPAVYRYSGPTFDALEEAVVGWMLREEPSKERVVYDPATVVNAFALSGRQRTAVPFVLDLVTGEVVYLDVYLPGRPRASAGRDGQSVGSLARAMLARRALKTDVASLVREHAAVRGAVVVEDEGSATITVGTSALDTYDALRPERLLADLL